MIGHTISHYEIVEKLGEGGMGVVYKAEDTKLKRPVALKFLRSDVLEDGEHRERFLREAQAAAALIHPNICVIHEIDKFEGSPFIAMELVEGETVKKKNEARPLKLKDALDIAIQVAQGLQAAHEKGIVHRDIKSANLMVTPRGQVKILDFGLAQLAERSQLTKTATILGTPAYMSPEQAQKRATDRRTDIWSLAVVVYEMLAGKLPFEGERLEAVLYAIGNEEPEPLTAQRVDVPVELDRIVGKAMAKDAGERYPHVDDMLVDLRRVEDSGARSQVQPATPAAGAQSRGAWYVAAVAVAVLVGLGAWSGWFGPQQGEPAEPMRAVPVTTYPGSELDPDFSPDGSRVVFQSSRTGTMGIWLADADGGNVKPLYVQEGAHSGTPRWSPDGQRVVFDSNPEGNIDIYVISARGGEPIQVTSHASDDVIPSWSRDGRWLYFGSRRTGRYEIWKVSAAGGEAVQLTREGGIVAFESPDGRTVFYTKTDEATASLWTIPAAGGEEAPVAERVFWRNIEVAEGGIYLIQSPDPSEPHGVFRPRFLDFSTGEIKTAATLPEGVELSTGMSVAPDGSALLYSRVENQGSDLMMIENFR